MPPFKETIMRNKLNDAEYKELKLAYARIAALVGGADGEFDQEEQDWAQKIVSIRSFSGIDALFDFHKEVKEEIGDDIESVMKSLNGSMEEIQQKLADQLSGINQILAKLDSRTSYNMYQGYLSFAKHIAKASGGLFRFFSISSQERKWIGLSMIHPIEEPAEEEE